MNCPVCPDTQLQMTERQGVEIDYCPKCRGVWLDRGELDKIIERANADFPTVPQPSAPPPPPQTPQPNQPQQPPYGPPPIYGSDSPQGYRKKDDSDYKFQYPQQGGHYPKKKKSILSDIFDF